MITILVVAVLVVVNLVTVLVVITRFHPELPYECTTKLQKVIVL